MQQLDNSVQIPQHVWGLYWAQHLSMHTFIFSSWSLFSCMMPLLQFLDYKTREYARHIKVATCYAGALNPELVGVFFFWGGGGGGRSWLRTGVSGARICNHSVCSWLMPLILSAGITQYLSCDLPAPDWGNQGTAEQQADVTAVRAHRVKLPGWHTAQV